MGNRAVITTREAYEHNGVGVYLHWNGGRDSVTAFLTYCKLRGFRSPTDDSAYAWARFCQVVGNWFGGSLSLGINTVNKLDCDNWDNGVYIVEKWEIVGRECFENGIEQDEYNLEEMLLSIDEAQPTSQQLGENVIKAMLDPMDYADATASLKVGSYVAIRDWTETIKTFKVCGFGENGKIVNGKDVSGVPFVDRYCSNKSGLYDDDDIIEMSDNINNYLLGEFFIVETPTENDDEPMNLFDI